MLLCCSLFLVALASQNIPLVPPLPEPLVAPVEMHGAREPRHLRASVYLGASEMDPSGSDESQVGFGFEVSGRVWNGSHLNVAMVRGPADIASPLVVSALHRPTVRATVRNSSWSLRVGDLRSAQHVLAGPVVRADGLNLSVKRGLLTEITVARPKYFAGPSGGHVAQGRLGVRTPIGTVSIIASDLTRPPRRSQPISVRAVEPQSAQEAEELDAVRRELSRESRVRGWGLEADLRFRYGGTHTLLFRSGSLDVRSHTGSTSHGAASEARYAFNHPRAVISAYARRAPESLADTYVPGDALSLFTSIRLPAGFSTNAEIYSDSTPLVGLPRFETRGASAGIERTTARKRRISVQANYSELAGVAPGSTISLSGRIKVPLGPFEFDARAEVGQAERAGVRRPLHVYRSRITAIRDGPSVWLSATHADYGFRAPRTRVDIGSSWPVGRVKLDAGVGYGRGQLLGDILSGWANIEFPMARQLTLLAGVNYLRWNYDASPYLDFLLLEDQPSPWRFTIGVRHQFGIPVPFARSEKPRRTKPD